MARKKNEVDGKELNPAYQPAEKSFSEENLAKDTHRAMLYSSNYMTNPKGVARWENDRLDDARRVLDGKYVSDNDIENILKKYPMLEGYGAAAEYKKRKQEGMSANSKKKKGSEGKGVFGREKFSVEALDAAQKEREENERRAKVAGKAADGAADKVYNETTKGQGGKVVKPVAPKVEPVREQAETSAEILAKGKKPENLNEEPKPPLKAPWQDGMEAADAVMQEALKKNPLEGLEYNYDDGSDEIKIKLNDGSYWHFDGSVWRGSLNELRDYVDYLNDVYDSGGDINGNRDYDKFKNSKFHKGNKPLKTPTAPDVTPEEETPETSAEILARGVKPEEEQAEVEVSASAASAPAASAAPAGVEPKKSVAEIVEGQKKILPGSANAGTVSAEAGTSDQAQHTASAGTSESVQSRVWNDEAYARFKELMPELAETLRGAKSIDDLLTPEQKAAMDPEAVARKKKGADFRRSMHELVELARIGSDIGASFAGGNAYKRKDPNYKQYEEEKAAIDKARNDALRSRLALAQEDRQRAKDLLSAFLPSFWNTKQTGQTSQTSDGTTHGETSRQGASLGHQNNVSHSYSHSDGGGGASKSSTITVTNPKNGEAYSYTFANEGNKKQFIRDRFNDGFAGQTCELKVRKDGDKKFYTPTNNISKTFLFWLNETPSGKKAASVNDIGNEKGRAKLFEIFRNVALNGKFGDEKDQKDGQNVYAGDQEAISKYMEQFEEVQKITTALVNGKVVSISSSAGGNGTGSYNEF